MRTAALPPAAPTGLDRNPCRRIPRKKGNALRNLRTFVPTAEQFQKLLASLATEPHVYEAVVVAASTGLRFSKVAGLRRSDLHEDSDGSWYVTTWDKNGELHAAPLFGQALDIVRARAGKPGTWLLTGPRDGQLRQKYVIARLKTACKASGIHYSGRDLDRFSFHSLRKYFATMLFNSGADIRTVQVCGNWKSISVVERYAKLSDRRKKAAFKTVAQPLGAGSRPPADPVVPSRRLTDARAKSSARVSFVRPHSSTAPPLGNPLHQHCEHLTT